MKSQATIPVSAGLSVLMKMETVKWQRGEYKGQRLSVLWAEHPELFGNEDGCLGDRFPLLIKIIDAKDDLSIQVHPDDAYAAANEKWFSGKDRMLVHSGL